VHDGVKWNVCDKKNVVDTLKTNAIEYARNKKDILDPNIKKDVAIKTKIERCIDAVDNNENSLDNFNDDFDMLLYNERDMVKKKKQLKKTVTCQS
jgi:hypothetical protein